MTIEELTKVLTQEGVDRVSAALLPLGFRTLKIQGDSQIPAENLSTGSIKLVDVQGNSITGHEIYVTPIYSQNNLTLNNVVHHSNIVHKTLTYYTDNNGVATVPLVKGIQVVIAIDQSSFYREITVPTTDFNFLSDDISNYTDAFSKPVSVPALTIQGDL